MHTINKRPFRKHSFLILCGSLLCFPCGDLPAADSPMYQQEIVVSETASPLVQQSAEALAGWLQKITGREFTVSERAAGKAEDTIQLWTADEAKDSPVVKSELLAKLDAGNPESFVLDGAAGQPGLRIIGMSDKGVRHGVYWYLRELGFRSLFPGENWQIAPKRENIRLAKTLAEAPAFLQRQFFGTGGFGGRLPLDPDMTIQKKWAAWKAANLFGESVRLSGHYGEAFIAKHKEVFEAHPEYRAMVDGERVPMSTQFQINYGNPELREMYIQDRLKDLRAALERPNAPANGISVSVDPADGGGHCTSPEAAALGSISDRVFGLANDVAKRIQAELPGNYVNLYAYNFHSDIPRFSMEKNVIVSVIPYGFNNARNLSGDDLLIAWGRKATLLGLYDYWALPDWSRDKPELDFLHTIPEKLRFWHDNNVRFFNAESTTSAGAAGITLYLASRILWDPAVDDKAALNEFYDLAFAGARAPMQRMLERWAAGFQLNRNELALSFRDLQEAYSLAGDSPEVRARIEDFVTFVQYLHLLNTYESAARGTPERHNRAVALLRYIWQIRKNAMVQTFRISKLMTYTWERKKDPMLFDAWDYKNPDASGWATVPEYPTSKEIAATLAARVAEYPVLFEPRRFSSDLVPLVPLVPPVPADEGMLETFLMIKSYTCVFAAEQDGPVKMDVFFGKSPRMEGRVTVTEANGEKKEVFHKNLPLNGVWNALEIPVEKGRTYVMHIDDRAMKSRLRVPATLNLVIAGGFVPVGWTTTKTWFFVPKGTRCFAISIPNNPIPDKLLVATADGSAMAPMLVDGDFTVYDVPQGEDGSVWSMDKFVSNLPVRLLNVPDNLAFSATTLMVPTEAQPETKP